MYDYFSPDPESNWPEEDERCIDCGALRDEACMESCATQCLASHNDLEEREADDPFASDPDDFEELNRNEADDYRHEGDDKLHCAGLELAEEWA